MPPGEHSPQLAVQVTVTRPSREEDRLAWNRALAFADIDWMSEVRVWDPSEQWLWPHLPYLLRIHGQDRVQRYGGVDPRKRVDNDFAAVVIRAYDGSGEREWAATAKSPLVSAEWYPHAGNESGPESVVHEARSDRFEISWPSLRETTRGQLRVWLIYADFLGAKLPPGWDYPEFAGGILAYYEVDWHVAESGSPELNVRALKPPQGTGFDWRAWANRPRGATSTRAVAHIRTTVSF